MLLRILEGLTFFPFDRWNQEVKINPLNFLPQDYNGHPANSDEQRVAVVVWLVQWFFIFAVLFYVIFLCLKKTNSQFKDMSYHEQIYFTSCWVANFHHIMIGLKAFHSLLYPQCEVLEGQPEVEGWRSLLTDNFCMMQIEDS